MVEEPAIRIVDLHKGFGENKVLRGINLDIYRGRINFIIGRSGGGKSVLLKHITGLFKPDRGRILIGGRNIAQLSEKRMNDIRKQFGMLFQDGALFDSMTVGENVAFPLRAHTRLKNKDIQGLVQEKLRQVGLEKIEDMMPSDISGGMRKRVGLARAMVLEPEILLFDEPTTGLDPIMSEQIDELIVNTQKSLNVTSIVISHDIPATLRIADKVAMVYQGKIIIHGTPDELVHSRDPVVRQFLEGEADGPMKMGD